MNANQTVDKIINDAKHSSDPERLWEMVEQLTRYGAWDQAEKVEHKAKEIERRQAEDV